MAAHSTNIFTAGNPLSAFGSAILAWMERMVDARARRPQIDALNAKTDAELAQMGLRRDAILHHVYRDLYYI